MKIKISFCLIAIISLLYSCTSDFIEANISKKNVVLLTPVNGYTTAQSNINFAWEEVKGTLKYHLQVASPSFATLRQIALDTLVSKLSFIAAFNTGSYECRLRGENGSSFTPYTYASFSVDTSSDISKKVVLLDHPGNDIASNSFKQVFNWFPITGAKYYILDIYKDHIIQFSQSVLQNTYYEYTFSKLGTYTWTVKAANDLGTSKPSISNTITIDNTIPNASTPAKFTNDTTSNPAHLSWTRDSDLIIGDSIYIFTPDSNITKKYVAKPLTTFAFTGIPSTIYQWRLKSIDRAGNVSAFSPMIKFKIK